MKVTSWREPEMQTGYTLGYFLPGEVAQGHWVAEVDVTPGSDLAHYLVLGAPAKPGLMGLVEAFENGGAAHVERAVRRNGWTRRSAERHAVKDYLRLAKEASMVEATRREREIEQ
jgi:hypothetical protein